MLPPSPAPEPVHLFEHEKLPPASFGAEIPPPLPVEIVPLPKMEAAGPKKVVSPESEPFKTTALTTAKPVPGAAVQTKLFTKAEFGNWETGDLVKVIWKLVGDEVAAKKYGEVASLSMRGDGFKIEGPSEFVEAVSGWVKVLKK